MKHFKGTIQRLNALKGEAWRKLLDLTAQFMPDTNKPEAEITARKQYSGFWIIRNGFSATMRPIIVLYRYLYAKARVVMGHKAQVSAAQAETIEVESAIQTATETPLSCASAKGMQIRRKERVSVRAALVAYRRAGLAYIRTLFFGVKAELDAAPGTVAAYREEMPLKRTAEAEAAPGAVTAYREEMALQLASKAVSADSAIMESRGSIGTATEAHGAAAQAESVPAVELRMNAKHTAQAGKAAVVAANVNKPLRTSHSARIATWLDPGVVDGVLILRQAYSATKNDTILEVE